MGLSRTRGIPLHIILPPTTQVGPQGEFPREAPWWAEAKAGRSGSRKCDGPQGSQAGPRWTA
eukprot:1151437-Pyramimonas_sp.AAC.1